MCISRFFPITLVLLLGPLVCVADQSLQSLGVADHQALADETVESADGQAVQGLPDEGENAVIDSSQDPTESSLTPQSTAAEPEFSNTPKSNLPSIGYVPDRQDDKGFDLVAAQVKGTDALYVQSVAEEKNRRYEAALKIVQKILSQNDEHPGARAALGRLQVKTQQYEAAKATLKALTDEGSDDWQPWFWLGTAHLMTNEFDAAEAALDSALSRNADVVEIWLHRALVEQERTNWRVAMQRLNSVHCWDSLNSVHCRDSLNSVHCRDSLNSVHCRRIFQLVGKHLGLSAAPRNVSSQ
ncbi:MAG: tetratricopeptide repeat protein, partial [Pseudomonadota bacterium]